MLENHLYNLLEQIVEESKSLWRVRTYKKDAGDCTQCQPFWDRVEKDKEQYISELNELIKNHLR